MSGNAPDDAVMDRRVRRTRRALIDAYNALILSKQVETIRVTDIIAAADVGRSTFYEHYSGRDAIHLDALSAPLGIVADALTGQGNADSLTHILTHFWDNRAKARESFAGPQRAPIARLLADLIEARLTANTYSVPARILAIQLSESQLGVIRAWITGDLRSSAPDLANAIMASSAGMLTTLGDRGCRIE